VELPHEQILFMELPHEQILFVEPENQKNRKKNKKTKKTIFREVLGLWLALGTQDLPKYCVFSFFVFFVFAEFFFGFWLHE
jgi:hypothetical protein